MYLKGLGWWSSPPTSYFVLCLHVGDDSCCSVCDLEEIDYGDLDA